MATLCSAQIIDGQLDAAFYGAPLSIQSTDTQFGDATQPDVIDAGGGSEIDQFFARVDNGRLYVLMAGNLERNFNKLEVFIDSETGGHNVLDGATLPGGVDGFCCGGLDQPNGALQRMNGLTFDSGFEADHYLTFTHGFETALAGPTSFWAASAHYSDLTSDATPDRQTVAAGMQLAPQGMPNVLRDQFGGQTLADAPFLPDWFFSGDTVPNNVGPALPGLGQGELIDRDYVLDPTGGGATDDSGAGAIAEELKFALDIDPADPMNTFSHRRMGNIIDLQMAIDNSNIAGVAGGTTVTTGDPENVMTGIEFSIPISELGISGDFKISAFINGGGHDYASNQFIGEGILTGNLGGDGVGGFTGDLAGVDLSTIAGDQFVTVTYTPANVSGDFDGNGVYECDDIDGLVAEIVAGTNTASFDMTGDGTVDTDDLDAWLAEAGSVGGLTASGNPVLPGDANLDGSVNGQDFVVWNANKFTTNAAWCSGDFNADGSVNGQDFVTWNANKFTTADTAAVPEPASCLLVLMSLGLFSIRRSRN
jgi:hypothetical protein